MRHLIRLATLIALIGLLHAQDRQLPTLLRDPAVCAGPDGWYYLTGTVDAQGPSGIGADRAYARGVPVWRSKDLQTWEDLGLVWDLWKHPDRSIHSSSVSAWQTELYPVPGLPAGIRGHGMTAPRLAYDGRRFWITFSMNGYAAGAMPGGAAVQDAYQDTQLLAEAGGAPTGRSDATLFVDDDGTRYLVWGGGCIARLKDAADLGKLSAGDVGVVDPVRFLPLLVDGWFTAPGPDRGEPYGPFVFRDGGTYRFIFTATTLRDGGAHEDAYICSADALFGTYTRPRLLLRDAGRCTAFQTGDRAWHLVHADADGHPMIVPLPQPAEPPAVAAAPRPGRVAVATQVPPRHVSEKPTDIRQMMPLLAPALAPPLRDAALCRGPDGTWYLIGTEGAQADDGTIDWSRNNGVHLWSSADRTSWTDAGLVWDIDRDATRSPASAWQLATHLDTTCGARTVVGSAVTAPEMRYLKGTFWIVYSMNGSGIGLLKSTSGKAEGPYADLGRIVAHGRDGSLFEEDGRVSLVWGAGYHARLSDDLTHLDGPVCALFTQVRWYPRQMRRPELMGLWGSHLVKQGDWYVWTFTTRTGRMGINAIDTCASWSTSLDGPWGEPCLMLPHGGQSTLVSDGTQGWLATVSGEDTASACPFQAAITPVVSGEGKAGSPLRCAAYGAQATVSQFATVHALQATELDLWIGYPDLLGTEERDVFVTRFGEDYYTTGTLWGDGGKYETTINLFTSRDLMHWTCIPDLYRIERIIDDGILQGAELERFRKAIAPDPARKRFQNPRVAEQKVYKAGDHYYITFQIIGSGLSAVLIKSAGSDIRGPYRAIQSIPGTMDMMVQDDGSVLYSCGGKIRRFGNLAEFERTRGPRGYFDTNTSAISNTELPNANFTEDCETGIERIAGKYVTWSTDWTGSYDGIYQFADDPQGPWRGAMRVIPHGGNGRFFQHRDGSWWYGAFVLNSNDWSTEAVDGVRFLPIPIDVTQVDRELVIEPKAMRANRARIDRMGALWHRPTPAGQVLR